MAPLAILLAIFLLPVLALIIYGFHPIKRWRYRHLPGPRPTWLLGNLLDIHREGQEGVAARWAQEYGPVFCFWLGGVPVVMTDDPELARRVLAKPARHKIWNFHREQEAEFEKHTLFFANGERWRSSRIAWQPFFSPPSLQNHSVRVADSADRLCELLAGAADCGQEVDMWRSLGQLTLDVIGSAAFGVDFNTMTRAADKAAADGKQGAAGGQSSGTNGSSGADQLSALSVASADALLAAIRTVFEVVGPANPFFGLAYLFPEAEELLARALNRWPNEQWRRELKARKIVLGVGSELVTLSKQATAASGGKNAPAAGVSIAADGSAGGARKAGAGPQGVDPGSFLAVVGRMAGKEVLPGVVQDDAWATNQATTFMSAGWETTASAVTFTTYLLATNPDKEAKLLAEINAFGRERAPSAEDVEASFPYATACIQESMRIYPPSVTTIRETATAMELGGHHIPAGTDLQVSMYSMHRSDKYWRDPLAYRPERFVAGTPEAEEVVPGAWIPFGSGSRACVGQRFAMLVAVVTLVRLYQKYTFRLLPGQVPLKTHVVITQEPIGGVRCTVHRRL